MDQEKSTVSVRINGYEYKISSTEPEEYIQKVAFYVDKKMSALSERDQRLSTAMAAVLTAVNVADDYFKAQEDADNLRGQLLKYVEEANQSRMELDKLKLDVERDREEIQNYRIEIAKLETELKQYRNRH